MTRGEYCPCTSQQSSNAIEFLRKYSTGLGWYIFHPYPSKKSYLCGVDICRNSIKLPSIENQWKKHSECSSAYARPMAIRPTWTPIDVVPIAVARTSTEQKKLHWRGELKCESRGTYKWKVPRLPILRNHKRSNISNYRYSHHLWSGWVRW